MQKFGKTVKRIAAVGTGLAFMGATVTGALAADLDLANYPSPFVVGGEYDNSNVLVVGAAAAASDTLGLTDIATNLQFESKDCSSTGGGSVSVSGGKTAEVPLGETLSGTGNTRWFDVQLEDDDVDTLIDSTITFQSSDYDVREILVMNATGNIKPETSLSSSEDDYKTDVFLEVARDALKYYYAFDDTILINATTSSDPLNIKFLGKTLKITSVNSANKFTAYVGSEYFMDVGDSVEVSGKTVTLNNVGSTGAIVVDVDGVSQTISSSSTRTVNGLEIVNDDTFYEDNKDQRSATLIVGKEASDSYQDGDAYPGEDKDDPDWVWDIGNLHTEDVTTLADDGSVSGPYIGVENDFVWNDYSDNPPAVGECIEFPNKYLEVCLDSLTVADADYSTYTFEYDNSADLSDAIGSYTSVSALYMEAGVSEGFKLIDTDLIELNASSSTAKTKKVWIYDACDNDDQGQESWGIFYEDTNGKVQLFGGFNESTGEFLEVNYENSKSTDLVITARNDSATEFFLDMEPYDATYLPEHLDNISMYWKFAGYAFSGLGNTSNTEDASELLWGPTTAGNAATTIGTKDEDHRTQYGIIVRNPKSNGASDRVKLEIPADQVMANIVVKGTSTTVNSGSTSCTVADITPVTKLDTEIAGSESMYNLILVGGPCANKAVEAVEGLGVTCAGWSLKEGEAMVKLAANGDKVAMFVGGTNALDTRRGAKVVANYGDYSLSGAEVLVKGTTLSDITVEAPATEVA